MTNTCFCHCISESWYHPKNENTQSFWETGCAYRYCRPAADTVGSQPQLEQHLTCLSAAFVSLIYSKTRSFLLKSLHRYYSHTFKQLGSEFAFINFFQNSRNLNFTRNSIYSNILVSLKRGLKSYSEYNFFVMEFLPINTLPLFLKTSKWAPRVSILAGSTELQVGPCVPSFGSDSHVLDYNAQGYEGQGRRWCDQACWSCYQLDCFALNRSYESNQDPAAQLWSSLSVQDLANYRNQKETCYHRKAYLQI